MELSEEWQTFLREQFPEGSRIRLRASVDAEYPVKPGSVGVLTGISGDGQFQVEWENGTSSHLTAADKFSVFPPEPETLKFYVPLNAEMYEPNEYGDMDDDPFYLDGRGLLGYEDQIVAQMVRERMPEEAERGLMHWYSEVDSVEQKVRSAVFTAESRAGQLWGVAECQVIGKLSNSELDTLRGYLEGQMADGWGEGFEQREIKVDNGEMYVHLWDSGIDWSIETEEERFGPKIEKNLPQKPEAAKKRKEPAR